MKKKTKQIMAWILIVILVAMYLLTLLFAIINTPWAQAAFRLSIVSTFLLPVMFYLIIFFSRLLTPAQMPDMKVEENAKKEAGESETADPDELSGADAPEEVDKQDLSE